MDKTQQNFAVMFADVAGSTRIYERLGDSAANQLIGSALQIASGIITHYQGVIVKTIGDEIMCRFSDSDLAIQCACDIHETMRDQPSHKGIVLSFRIGVHWGAALLQSDGDIFGDAVNLAARMAGVAKARQIIMTEMTYSRLTKAPLISKCRLIDHIQIKGKSSPVSIAEVMWEPDDVTMMSTCILESTPILEPQPLHIRFQSEEITLLPGSAPYTFGRDRHCDQIIDATLISRIHAKIESRRGKFILIDESTNGTYLQMDEMQPVFLRREEITLHGSGVISFGEEPKEGNGGLLHYWF